MEGDGFKDGRPPEVTQQAEEKPLEEPQNPNLSHLHRFGDIAGFVCAPEWPDLYSTLILGVFPLHKMAHVGVSPSRDLKLFGSEIIFEEFQHVWSRRDHHGT